jgi:4-hydroxybenzoate polyprenyltransferase
MFPFKAAFHLMRFHRPVGTLLLLWPTLWALWLATAGHPPVWIVIVFICGVIVMRAAGCVINDIADRNFDGAVARTKDRPLVTKAISLKQALFLFAILCLIAFGLVLTLNPFTIGLAFIGLALAVFYPFSKRFVPFPQFILGMAFNWSIIMAYAATTNTIPPSAWFLYAITLLWTIIYDTEYAMVDRDDDLKIGIKSTAIWFGKNDITIISLLHGIVLLGFILLGLTLHLTLSYWISLLIAAFLAIYQIQLLRTRQTPNYFTAFLNNNWYGMVIFLGILFHYV